MVKNWTGVKKDIERLYHIEKKPLSEVMRLVKGLHGFHASERSYRTQLQKWSFLKYNTEANPRVRNGAVTRRAGKRRRSNVQHPGQSADASSASTSSSSHAIFERSIPGFSLNDINHQQWNFETEAPIEGASTSYTNIQYGQSIRNASAVPVQYVFHLDDVDTSGQTALHRAIVSKDSTEVKTLLEKGATVDIKDNFGNQPLHCAVMSKDLDLVRLLLRYGADINIGGNLGCSPLHLAISVSDPDVARLLLEEGASTNSQDDNGESALHLAVSMQSWNATSSFYYGQDWSAPLIDILVTAKPDMNIPNARGFTPFHKLLNRNYVGKEYDYMYKFIEAGASVHLPLPNGLSPFEVFLAKSEFPWSEYRYESLSKNNLLQSFIKRGADPAARLPSGEPLIVQYLSKCLGHGRPLWGSNRGEDFTLLDLFCKHVRIGPIEENGNTMLHQLALICGGRWRSKKAPFHEAMKALIKRGEDPNRQNLEGETPLLLLFTNLTRSTTKPVVECLMVLLSHGADPMICDSNGRNGLFAAAKELNSDELDSVLKAIMELKGSTNLLQRPERSGLSRFVWNDWEQAVREDNWADAKAHILTPSADIPGDIAQKLRDSAFRLLAGRHIDLARTKFQGESDALEKRRTLVTTILRDCRLQSFGLQAPWIDFLLTLC